MSSSRASGTWPLCTAAFSFSPKLSGTGAGAPKIVSPPGISRSSPALADSTVLWFANQSETTKPRKPQSRLRMSVSRCGFWHAYAPLTWL